MTKKNKNKKKEEKKPEEKNIDSKEQEIVEKETVDTQEIEETKVENDSELQKDDNETENLKKQIEDLKFENEKLKSKPNTTVENETLKKELDLLKNENLRLKDELNIQKQNQLRNEDDLNKERKEIQELQNENTELKIKVKELNTENDNLVENYQRVCNEKEEKELNDAQTKITQNKLKKQFETLVETHFTKEKEFLLENIEKLTKKVVELENKLKEIPKKPLIVQESKQREILPEYEELEVKPSTEIKENMMTTKKKKEVVAFEPYPKQKDVEEVKKENEVSKILKLKEKFENRQNIEPYKRIYHIKFAVENLINYFESIPPNNYDDIFDSTENPECLTFINNEICENLIKSFVHGFNNDVYWFSSVSIWSFVEEVGNNDETIKKLVDKINKYAEVVNKYTKDIEFMKFRIFIFECLNDQNIDKIIKTIMDNELRNKYYYHGANILQEEYREKIAIYLSVLSVLPFKLAIHSLMTPNGLNLETPKYYI